MSEGIPPDDPRRYGLRHVSRKKADPKDKTIGFRLTTAEYEELELAAFRANQSLADFLRQAGLERARKEQP